MQVVHISFAMREQISDNEKPSGFERIENRPIGLKSPFPHVMEHKIGDSEIILYV